MAQETELPSYCGAVACPLLLLVCLSSCSQDLGKPADTMARLHTVIDSGQRATFESLVDVEAFSAALAADFVSYGVPVAIRTPGETQSVAEIFDIRASSDLRSVFATEIATKLRALAGGEPFGEALAGQPGGRELDLTLMASILGMRSSTYDTLTGVERDGDVAIAGVRFRSPPMDTTLVFEVVLERGESNWVVKRPYNVADLISAVDRRRQTLISRSNHQALNRMKRHLEFGHVAVFDRRSGARLLIEITNASGRMIEGGRIGFRTPDDDHLGNPAVSVTLGDLAPGESSLFGVEVPPATMREHPELHNDEHVTPYPLALRFRTAGDQRKSGMPIVGTWDEYLEHLDALDSLQSGEADTAAVPHTEQAWRKRTPRHLGQ